MNDHSFTQAHGKQLIGQLLSRAEGMIQVLHSRAEAADRDAVLAPETVQELKDSGFFRIMQPTSFGGYEMRPSVLWEVTRHIGRGCGSSGFVLSLLGLNSWMVGMFEPEAQRDVFGDGGDVVLSNLSIGARRENDVCRTVGGYTVSGAWTYATGIDFADWVITAIRTPDDNGASEERIALIPAGQFRAEPDSWNVFGARATGSRAVTLHQVHVPSHRTMLWSDVQAGTYPGLSINQGPLYRASAGSLLVLSSAAPVVAVASGLVDAFIAQMKSALRRRQAEQQWNQVELGACASQIHMSHSLLIRDADEIYDTALAREELGVDVQARHRADAAMIARTALEAGQRLFSALGGSVLDASHPATRAFRDVHAMATHWRVQPVPACELYGRVLLGFEES